MSIYYGSEEYNLFTEMTVSPILTSKIIGKGEAAAISLCKCNNGILASNNLKDIIVYVKEYNLKTLLTENILVEAFNKKMITEQEENNIWQNMLEKRRKLPYLTFSECLKKYELIIK